MSKRKYFCYEKYNGVIVVFILFLLLKAFSNCIVSSIVRKKLTNVFISSKEILETNYLNKVPIILFPDT